MQNEVIYYVDSRSADKSPVVVLAGISYPDPTYKNARKNSGVYVFEYVLEGRGVVCVDKVRYEVEAGDVYILKKGENHSYYSDKKEPMKKIWFNVDGRLIAHLLSDYSLSEITHIKGFGDSRNFFKIRKKLLDYRAEGRLHDNEVDVMLHILIKSFADFIKNRSGTRSEAEILKEYIDSHVDASITIETLAAQIFRSQTHTINIFRQAFGRTPYDYMLERKIEAAKLLLKNTTMKIGSICTEVGFSESQYFSRYFKKKTGLTPLEYRKESTKDA